MSAISSATQSPLYGTSGAPAAGLKTPAADSGYEIHEDTYAASHTVDGSAAVSLGADLSQTTATTQTGGLTLAIAKALQSATAVDPATGHRELVAGAGDQLTATINTLLTENGFSADEAAGATAGLSKELAQGGQISLSASVGSNTGPSNYGLTQPFGVGGYTTQALASTNSASSGVTIGIDLDTGALTVALKTQYSFVQQDASLAAGLGYSKEDYTPYQLASESGGVYGPQTTDGTNGSPLSETETKTTADDEEGTRQIVDTLDGSQSVLNVSFSLVDGQYSSTQSSVAYDKSLFATPGGQQLVSNVPDLATILASTGQGQSPPLAPPAQPKENATTNDDLKRLLQNLSDPKIFKETQASGLVQQLAALADGVRAQLKATSAELDKQAADREEAAKSTPQTAAQEKQTKDLEAHAQQAKDLYKDLSLSHRNGTRTASFQVAVRQTVSYSQADQNGHGTTLYRRPNGSLGQYTLSPTTVTA